MGVVVVALRQSGKGNPCQQINVAGTLLDITRTLQENCWKVTKTLQNVAETLLEHDQNVAETLLKHCWNIQVMFHQSSSNVGET